MKSNPHLWGTLQDTSFIKNLNEAYDLLEQKGHIKIGVMMGCNVQYLFCAEQNGEDTYHLIYDHMGLVIRKNKKQIYNQFEADKTVRSRFFKPQKGEYFTLQLMDKYDRQGEMANYVEWRKANQQNEQNQEKQEKQENS